MIITKEQLAAQYAEDPSSVTVEDILAAPTQEDLERAARQTRRLIEFASPIFQLSMTTTLQEIVSLVNAILSGENINSGGEEFVEEESIQEDPVEESDAPEEIEEPEEEGPIQEE